MVRRISASLTVFPILNLQVLLSRLVYHYVLLKKRLNMILQVAKETNIKRKALISTRGVPRLAQGFHVLGPCTHAECFASFRCLNATFDERPSLPVCKLLHVILAPISHYMVYCTKLFPQSKLLSRGGIIFPNVPSPPPLPPSHLFQQLYHRWLRGSRHPSDRQPGHRDSSLPKIEHRPIERLRFRVQVWFRWLHRL